jgi:hypothetical protein
MLFELKTGHKDAKESKIDIKLFQFDPSEELKQGQSDPKAEKHLAKPCIYLNICHSSKVKLPLTKTREYADPKDDLTWAIIPISYGKESEDANEIIYDAHINSAVIEKCKGNTKILNSVLNVIMKRFEQLMINKYRMDIKSCHVLAKKLYKSSDSNKTTPGLHILMPD